MKIYFKRKFKYCWDTSQVFSILPGTYEVPRQIEHDAAKLALEFGAAVMIVEPKKVTKKPKFTKKAPENKAKRTK